MRWQITLYWLSQYCPLNALLRYSSTDSNIEFYDETEWLTSVGITYKF
ncbi:DUF2860 family protein [Photobacterium sp. OFAV2-7]